MVFSRCQRAYIEICYFLKFIKMEEWGYIHIFIIWTCYNAVLCEMNL